MPGIRGAVHRLLSLILLICFGALAPLQGAPLRWCLQENRLVGWLPGSSRTAEERTLKCCGQCGSGHQDRQHPEQEEEQEHSGDCCVDRRHLPESRVPGAPERLAAWACLVTMLPVLDLADLFSPVIREEPAPPPGIPDPLPAQGRKRQAVLSVWTV